MVMRTTLSKKEFASALGMSDTDVFVLKMFNIVDRDGDGRISFQEFLDTIVLFSKVRLFLQRRRIWRGYSKKNVSMKAA
jgi:dual oxidase